MPLGSDENRPDDGRDSAKRIRLPIDQDEEAPGEQEDAKDSQEWRTLGERDMAVGTAHEQ